jgi:endonuclease/exonuclease/phosphatase family metal-dependent hydrolase
MRKTTIVTISLLIKSLALIGLFPALFAESIVVMSYNIHRGGVVCNKQPLSQTAKGIQLAKPDIVGIQETRSPRGDTLEDLAKLLGWNHDEGQRVQHFDPL